MANWLDYMSNPRGHYLKRTMFEVLKDRYAKNEQIIERMGVTLLTEGDLESFMKMVGDIYEIAYLKAVDDHKEQLQKAGLVAKIVSPN
jgi:hypothetical protein